MLLTGIGAATARGQMAADGITCGTGTRLIVLAADGLPLFDARGNAVERETLPCLDCTLGMLAEPAPVAPLSRPLSFTALGPAIFAEAPPAQRAPRMAQARAPPVSV